PGCAPDYHRIARALAELSRGLPQSRRGSRRSFLRRSPLAPSGVVRGVHGLPNADRHRSEGFLVAQSAVDRILLCKALPTLPGVALEVLELARDRGTPVEKIADVVQNDRGLAAKVLKTVNASYYGLRKPC